MRLGIDLDGVVADFNAGWMRLHGEEFGSQLDATDPALVGRWDGLHLAAGFADMREFWRWAAPQSHRRSIFRHLDPYPGAVDALRRLEEAGHDIVIITTKPKWARSDTLHWIADNELPTSEVHLIDDKWRVHADVYVDDSPTVVPSLVEHRPEALVCRVVRPWNRPVDGALDVLSWDDVERAIGRYPNG